MNIYREIISIMVIDKNIRVMPSRRPNTESRKARYILMLPAIGHPKFRTPNEGIRE
jgi:hypothetical protein